MVIANKIPMALAILLIKPLGGGEPHDGHAAALLLIGFPHSLQSMIAIVKVESKLNWKVDHVSAPDRVRRSFLACHSRWLGCRQ